MTRALAARIERLEARHRIDAAKVRGIIGGLAEPYVEEIDGVLHLIRPETPTGEPFVVWGYRQQRELQDLLASLADTEAPQDAEAPGIVGTLAPLKPGQKVRKFIHLPDGTEIQLKRN